MISELPPSLLALHLREKEPALYGKAYQLRDQVRRWLEYVPNTFPHYTTHTIEHSDSIIQNLSLLLFNEEKSSLVVALSPMEVFILLASAYLHDSGMVASDEEKLTILQSQEWRRWIRDQHAREEELAQIDQIRTASGLNEEARSFAADLCLRHLLAEYIRGRHHLRAADVIKAYTGLFTPLLARNQMLAQTLADICVSHGLDRYELENSRRFPESRTIAGQKVNVRFMAILLRIGDLLDMSNERACPLLMNAASPLPPESYAHWAQYEGIEHFLARLTSARN
jgi:molecular chaperone HtpG